MTESHPRYHLCG